MRIVQGLLSPEPLWDRILPFSTSGLVILFFANREPSTNPDGPYRNLGFLTDQRVSRYLEFVHRTRVEKHVEAECSIWVHSSEIQIPLGIRLNILELSSVHVFSRWGYESLQGLSGTSETSAITHSIGRILVTRDLIWDNSLRPMTPPLFRPQM